jgi:Tol biopolymer transport system component
MVNADGGPVEEILAQEGVQGVPAWSPNGTEIAIAVNWISYSDPPSATPNAPRGIYVVDLATRRAEKISGSDGLTSPMWSPDGKYFTAKSADETSLLLFDPKAGQWKAVAKGAVLSGLTWSKDSQYLFVQRIVDCRSLLEAGAERCLLQNSQADGSLVFRLENTGGQVYALDLAFP